MYVPVVVGTYILHHVRRETASRLQSMGVNHTPIKPCLPWTAWFDVELTTANRKPQLGTLKKNKD